MCDDIGLGAFLDREGVLEEGGAVLAEGDHTATGIDFERACYGRCLDILCNRFSIDRDVQILAWHTLHDVDLRVIGRVAWTDRQPRQSQNSCSH